MREVLPRPSERWIMKLKDLYKFVKQPLRKYKKALEDFRNHQEKYYHKYSIQKMPEFVKLMTVTVLLNKSKQAVIDASKCRIRGNNGFVDVHHATFEPSTADKEAIVNGKVTGQLVLSLLEEMVSVTSAKHSFPTLRKLKTWLRAQMGQTRLSGLALLNLHHDIDISIDRVIDRKIETMTCLQDTNRRLRDELTILQSQFDEVKNKLDTATKELDSLKAKIKEAEDESTQYRSLADSRDQQLKEVTEQTQNSKKTFEKELNILKGEEEAKSAQILSLKSSLDMRMAQIECFEKVKEAIREERQKEVEKLENDLKVANVTMKFLGQKTTDLQNEIKAVKTSADEKDDNYRNEVIAHARSVDAMKLLREEFKEVSKRLVAAEKIAADAKSKEKLIEAKCSVDVQALETRLSELNLVSVSELRKINEILQDQVAKLSEAAEAERNLSVSSTLDEERTNQQLLEVISFLRRDSKMTRTHLERSEAECSQLTAQLKQIRLQLESSEADLKKERTTQRASLGAPEGETLLRKIETMTCLQDTNRRLRDELTILQSQFDEVKNKLDTATKELDSLKEKNRKLNEQFDSISVEATVLRTEIARVKTQSAVFSRGVTERAKFQAEKESLEKSLKSKEAEVARIKNSLDNALKHFESAQKNFDQSKITVEQLNARNEQMKSKMEES
ncbi:hypothetical protein QYM36_012503, partial [Artemia franciscana]